MIGDGQANKPVLLTVSECSVFLTLFFLFVCFFFFICVSR